MNKYKAKRYVLESIWEEQWVECEADSIEEAETKFDEGDCNIIDSQMGELGESGIEVNVEDIKLIEPKTKESDNG
tara:strand:- start:271 stop:495 length:225 start_codon:yes stop_codon:yes gene_type:complete